MSSSVHRNGLSAQWSRPSREDFWRVIAFAGEAVHFKEWQHFILIADGLELLLNFSLTTDEHGHSKPRLIVLAHTTAWHGFVQTLDASSLRMSADGCRAEFGRHRYCIGDDDYRVVVDAPEHAFAADLRLVPATVPMTVRNQSVAPGRRLHWMLHARLHVEGAVEVDGRTFALSGGSAYHDHNWGTFSWGDDLSWEWGVALPVGSCPWTLVYSQLTNRARGVRKLEHLLLWDGAIHVFLAHAAELRTIARGRWQPQDRFQRPASLSLLHTRRDDDLPRQLQLNAVTETDHVEVCFEPEVSAQLLIPSELDALALVRIHECVGRVRVHGEIRGKRVQWEGRGVFEFVRQ